MLAYIDHVTIAVRDVDASAAQLRNNLSLIVSTPRHDEQAGLTNATVPLTRGYLELISPDPLSSKSSDVCRRLHGMLESHEGLFSFAINSRDVRGDVALLRERGSTLAEPVCERLGADSEGEWWSSFPAEDSLEPYLVQHGGDSSVSMSKIGGRQPLGIRSIEEMAIITPDVERTAALYERDFGITISRRFGRQVQMAAGVSRIMLIPTTAAPMGSPIGLYSATIGTTDIKGARSELSRRNVELIDDPLSWSVATRIDPALTFGARISLAQL
jgi:hypothetical protein